MRVGWGFDAHRFAESGVVILGGVAVDDGRGVEATSDGDVLAHAVADALLGAAVLGDLGGRYPSEDPASRGADSMAMLAAVSADVEAAGWRVTSVDVTVVSQTIRVGPYRDEIRARLAEALAIPVSAVSVKATTTDTLGFIGRDEGLAAMAVVVLQPAES